MLKVRIHGDDGLFKFGKSAIKIIRNDDLVKEMRFFLTGFDFDLGSGHALLDSLGSSVSATDQAAFELIHARRRDEDESRVEIGVTLALFSDLSDALKIDVKQRDAPRRSDVI